MELVGAQAWTAQAEICAEAAAAPLVQLLIDLSSATRNGASLRRARLVLESALLPVQCMSLGSEWLGSAGLEALARHRLQQVWGNEFGMGAALRLVHRPGSAAALVYALAPGLLAGLREAGASAGWTWTALQPAFEWWQGRMRRLTDGWWVCVEQDRALVACWQQDNWQALDPAAPLPDPRTTGATAHWIGCARHAAHRQGLVFPPSPPLRVLQWGGGSGAEVRSVRESADAPGQMADPAHAQATGQTGVQHA